ncbi:MAG: hypothetical protein JOZ57_14140, partial [Abitibacteriaceae bacterium]|nr:hypothetical protein [Abditibacteriaceae bacterium]
MTIPTAVTVPGTVTIPSGAASATFAVAAVNDSGATCSWTVRVTANALPLQSGSATVTVTSPRRRATVALSTVTANVATGSVTLRFGGALDAESVRDVSHYAVQVNGHSVRVESAGYNAAVYTVTLSLAEGAL